MSMDSFTERSPFVVPADGKNLNRAFPGDPDGTTPTGSRTTSRHG